MCACNATFVCSRCAGTPFDPSYFDSDPEPVTDEFFSELVDEHRLGPVLMFGEE